MKIFSAEALSALESGEAIVAGAVWFAADDPFGFWSGFGFLALDDQAHVGVGDRGLITTTSSALGGAEQGVSLRLSGVDPDVAATLDLGALRRLPVVIRRLIFNKTGATLLDAKVWLRGRVDSAQVEETPGGPATIVVGVEGAARGLGRRSERMRTDADQRLIDPNDGCFSRVAHSADKVIYFGGRPPARTATALPNSGGAGGGRGSGGGMGLDLTDAFF